MSSAPNTATSAPSERSSFGPAVAWALLGIVGAGLVLAAIALQTGHLPANAWPMRGLIAAGFDAGALGSTGLVLCGLALLARSLRSHALALARGNDLAPLERVLDERMDMWNGSAQALQAQQLALQGALAGLEQKIETMRQESRAASAKDAIYRMAASLDQLGARVETRLADARGTLEHSIQGVGDRVEQAREQLSRRFQETIRSIGTLSAEETLAGTYDERFPFTDPSAGVLGERSFRETNPSEVLAERSLPQETPRTGELSIEIEREHAPDMDLGVLGSIADEPGSRAVPATPVHVEHAAASIEALVAPRTVQRDPPIPPSPLPVPPRKETPARIPLVPRPASTIPLPRLDETWGHPKSPERGS